MKYILFIITILVVILTYSPRSVVVELEKESPTLVSNEAQSKASSTPITTDEAKIVTTALADIPNDSEWAVISKYPYRHVIAQIYKGESSFGRHDICRRKGLFNGFGYAEPNPLVHGPTCYESFEAVVAHVNNWIDQRVHEGFDLAEMNCYYVRGVRSSECKTAYKLN